MIKNIVAILCISLGLLGLGVIPIPSKVIPKPTPVVSILNIDKPDQKIIDSVSAFSDLIKDPTDRAKFAIFNYQFAQNVKTYTANVQQVNDIYVLAGKTFFKNSIVGKYKGLSDMLKQQIQDITSDDDHILSEDEKTKIHDQFLGIAWVLIQRN